MNHQVKMTLDLVLCPEWCRLVLIILAVLKVILGLREPGKKDNNSNSQSVKNVYKLIAITALGFAYVVFFSAFGYFVSTLIALVVILYLFEIRKLYRLIPIAVGGSVLYYLLFVGVMKIYDPPGDWINFQSIMPF